MIDHHPDEAVILDYVAGALPVPVALAVAAHASLCPCCATQIQALETIGGALLALETPLDCIGDALTQVLLRLDKAEAEPAVVTARPQVTVATRDIIPPPLRQYVNDLDAVPWRTVGGMYDEFILTIPDDTYRTFLCRVPAGSAVPPHSHEGEEYVLVLRGGYRDGDAQFTPGDFAALDVGDTHAPEIDPSEPCLCLVVQSGPAVLPAHRWRDDCFCVNGVHEAGRRAHMWGI